MPIVRFTATPVLPADMKDRPYKEGYECEMSVESANRWVRRGVAMIVPPAAASRIAREAMGAGGRAAPQGGGAGQREEEPGTVTSSGTVTAAGTAAAAGSTASTGTVAAGGSVASGGTVANTGTAGAKT